MAKGGPQWPHIMLAVSICWLLRGAEAADLLGEQGETYLEQREADLDLCATKTDPQGRGCVRKLKCLCDSGLEGPCPFCSLKELMDARAAAGYGPEDPLFPTREGRAPERRAVVQTWRAILGIEAGEHTSRREGVQLYTRRGVFLFLTQFLGRWGSNTVARYAGEALKGQLAEASAARASGHEVPVRNKEADKQLRATIEQLIQKALVDRADNQRAAEPALQMLDEAPAGPGVPVLGHSRQVQRTKAGSPVGLIQDVVIADPSIPRAAWLTRCTWKFGLAEHRLTEDGATTCAKCLSGRVIRARKRAAPTL